MKRGAIWVILTCLMVTSLVLASCNNATTTTTSTSTSTTTSTTTKTTTTTTTTTAQTSTTTTTTSSTGHWWDKLGVPQYGGEINMRISTNIQYFDPNQGTAGMAFYWAWMEGLFRHDWTTDPAIQDYKFSYPSGLYIGALLTTWEFTAPGNFVLHVRQGMHWQNIPPANGREFTASDIVFHFNRMCGLGDGYTAPNAYFQTDVWVKYLTSVTATDKYTVVMKFSTSNPEFIIQNLQAPGCDCTIENPEAVKQWGNLYDWHNAIGTGPFILTDFVSDSSITLVKNQNYWGYDDRYPQNHLPYVDKLNGLIIPDNATALAGMRTGKLDLMDTITLQDAQSMKKTNPEIVQIPVPNGNANTIDPRDDKPPFNDVRVRKALQMAIDLPTIAQSFYGGSADPYPSTLTSNYLKGWGFPYDQWPQDLKDEYAYNPTAAKKLLADAGYPNGFKTNIVAHSAADLDLLLIVQSYFAKIGVDMSINVMTPAAFSSFVVSGRKQDALAMRNVGAGALALTFYPIRQLTKFYTASSQNIFMVSDPTFDAFYDNALAATSTDQVKKIITDANKYVAQQHFAISLLQPMVYYLSQPWLKGFNGQYGATAQASGPFFANEYEAAFWIDANLKKSMGH